MTRYLSYFGKSSDIFKNIEDNLYKAKHLRSFLALDYKGGSEIKMPRARCLSGLKLPDSISKMKHLRYLDFSKCTDINILPDSICMLCNLQTLKLAKCWKLERLPRDMWKLINLRHLELDDTIKLQEMPIQMDRLKCLQTLSKFIVSKHDNGSSNIGELGKLINLRGKLLFQKLQNVISAKDALNANLKDKRYLEELVLEWYPPEEHDISRSQESQRGVIEKLQPHEKLKSLTMNCYGGRGFPDWIGPGLHSLSKLELINCKNCSDLPTLGQLPSLNELYICGLDRVVTVGPEFYINSCSFRNPFGRLKLLWFENMSNWKDWSHWNVQNEVKTYFQLEKLYIAKCPKLKGMLPVHLPSLKKLEIYDCQHLKDSLSIESFPVLTPKEITGCDNLESFPLPEQRKHDGIVDFINCLQELRIYRCSLPMSLPKKGLPFPLKVLDIYDCDSLVSFPLNLFPNLKRIRIQRCRNLKSLEQHDGVDSAISFMHIRKCPNFVSFPKGGLRARNLANFILYDCESLRSMPDKMHLFLPSLYFLVLVDNPKVESFSEGGLPFNLKQIVICRCSKLIANWKGRGLQSNLQILPSLEWLEITWNDKLEDHVESFPGGLLLPTTLSNLNISSFGNLKSLENEGFQHLTSLIQLVIRNCPKLRCMPEEGFPPSLHLLHLSNCDDLLMKELKKKRGKEWLKVARIPNIIIGGERIQGDEWPACISLYYELDTESSNMLPDQHDREPDNIVPDQYDREPDNCIVKYVDDVIVDFNNCLQELRISRFPSHMSLLQKGSPSPLKVLEIAIHDCDSLVSFPLGLFPNLESIQIKRCRKLKSLEQHGVHLVIDKMHKFLPSLRYLELVDCPEVESFPKGGLPSNLKHIVIKRCKKLIANMNVWGLQILPSLEWSEIISDDKLEDYVKSFPERLLLSTTLTNLNISSFKNLESLDKEGFQHLTSLVQLKIYNCPKLKYMPEEGFHASLCFLDIWNCHVLEEKLKRKEGEEWLKVARLPNIIIGGKHIQGDEWPACISPYHQFGSMDTVSSHMVPDQYGRGQDNNIVKFADDIRSWIGTANL